jgi:hypothetical protein
MIKSIPSHILTPNFYYDFIIYSNAGSGSPYLSTQSASTYIMTIQSVVGYSGPTTNFLDYVPVNKYNTVYPITLNHLHVLTREAGALNSLLICFTVGVATTTDYYL